MDFRRALEAARQDWPAGLRHVAADAAGEMTGRNLFLLKLEVARLYVDKGRHDLAGVILEGLNTEAKDRALDHWEGRNFVAAIKALLCQCRELENKDQEAGLLREELCQLAPWLVIDTRSHHSS